MRVERRKIFKYIRGKLRRRNEIVPLFGEPPEGPHRGIEKVLHFDAIDRTSVEIFWGACRSICGGARGGREILKYIRAKLRRREKEGGNAERRIVFLSSGNSSKDLSKTSRRFFFSMQSKNIADQVSKSSFCAMLCFVLMCLCSSFRIIYM